MTTRRPRVPRAARPDGSGTAETSAARAASADGTGSTAADRDRPAARVIRPEFSRRRTPDARPTPAQARAAERSELAGAIRRPQGQARPVRPAPGGRQVAGHAVEPVPAKAFSGRMLALAVVLITITVLLAPSMRVFIEQRSAISKLRADIEQEQAAQAQLKKEIARWDDPEYIKQQARDRIFYVMPGETRYMVTGTEGLSESKEHASKSAPSDLPWVDALWDSVKRSATDSPAAR
ncbi:septum formation initiator family protein [Arthrobacter sp. I2-34]|uniref:Septum formation initiator family protein n=1 Tax=Arthrobacter hankyongi TaxID=2904801 RepID=A0ABS9L1R4_9MICC|nr:septum formation initiator family protein [Arthrobacter hankyongi]MCG2620637.1 septum formation initiator family protein [Arthrobacter hankyongi]